VAKKKKSESGSSGKRAGGGTFFRVLLCVIVVLFVCLLVWQLVFNKDGKGSLFSWPGGTEQKSPGKVVVAPKPTATKPAWTPPATTGEPAGQAGAARAQTDGRYIHFAGAPKSKPDMPVEILTNKAYMVGYSERRRDPAWVAYRVFKVAPGSAPKRPEHFKVDSRTQAAVNNADFSKTGYDKGHMAPNRVIGLLYGPAAQEETFLLSNIVPQKPSLNRGTWRKLEEIEADKLAVEFEEIWVTTGPVFEEKPAKTLLGGVAIPTGFYKIFIDEDKGGPRAITFLIPQDVKGGENLQMFLTTVRQVEGLTGLDFNPQMNKALQEKVETAIPAGLW
jgi:endonuclease G, mitochondrial